MTVADSLHPDVPIAVRTITACRLCGSSDLTDLFSLGEQFVSDFVSKDAIHSGVRCPIDLVFCKACSLPQLRHTAPQELLYSGHYHYRSGVTRTMRDALRDVTKAVEKAVPLELGSVVVDIGSNDGTLLRSYSKPGIVRVGVEPAKNLAEQGRQGVDVFINDFWSAAAYDRGLMNRKNWVPGGFTGELSHAFKAKVVTALGMLYDLEDPNSFVADVAKILRPDGVFVAQLMCARQMLASNDIGNLNMEHLEFYTLQSLDKLFSRHGLEIYDARENETNGGSYRLLVRHFNGREKTNPRLYHYRLSEYSNGLHSPETYLSFFKRAEENKRECVSFLQGEYMRGKRIFLLGASTKSSTVLQWMSLDSSIIQGASERSSDKWGKFTTGTGIQCFSEEEARQAKPDLFVTCLFGFKKEIVEREREFLLGGGRIAFLLPRLEVVGKEALT